MRIQILENGLEGYLDLLEGSSAVFTESISNVKELSKASGGYSNTLKIAPTKEANYLLGHLFSVHINELGAKFNPRKKIRIDLVEDGITVKENLIFQLKTVEVSSGTPLSYSAEVYDETSELFNDLNNKLLSDIDLSEGDHVLTPSNIISSMANTSEDIYRYHLTTTNGNEYNLSQFKPAIFAKPILKRIAAGAGVQMEVEDGELIKFDKHLVPCAKQNLNEGGEPVVIATRSTDTGSYNVGSFFATGLITINMQTLIGTTEIVDPLNAYDNTSGVFTPFANFPAGEAILFKISFTAKLRGQNTGTIAIKHAATWNNPNEDPQKLLIKAINYKNGTQIGIGSSLECLEIKIGETIPALSEIDLSTGEGSLIIACGSLEEASSVISKFGSEYTNGIAVGEWLDVVSNSTQQAILKTTFTEFRLEIVANTSGGFYIGNNVRLSNYLNDKMKQSDFLKSLITLHNLVVEREDVRKFKLKRWEQWITEGELVDWETKIDRNNYTLTPISELSNKTQLFTYKADKDSLNEIYTTETGEIYGQLKYYFDSEHVRGEGKKEIAFAPTPIHRTAFGAVVPALNGNDPKHEPRLLLAGDLKSCNPYKIMIEGAENITVNQYGYVGHLDDPDQPSLDLNFAPAKYYFLDLPSLTANNMFNLNWRKVTNQINSGRILKAKFNLSVSDIRNLKLNTTVFVLGEYWQINEVKYNLNRKIGEAGYLAELELVSAIDKDSKGTNGSEGGNKPTKPSVPNKPNKPIISTRVNEAVSEAVTDVSKGKNTFLNEGGSNVFILGTNNTIQQGAENALVVGNNQQVTQSGVYTPYLEVNGIPLEDLLLDLHIEELTRAEFIQLIEDGELVKGKYYKLIDRYGVTFYAITNKLPNVVWIERPIVKNERYTTATATHRGMLKELTSYSVGNTVVWGGRCWLKSSGGTQTTDDGWFWGTFDPNTSNTSGWVEIENTNEDFYEFRILKCEYNLKEDILSVVQDWKGNRLIGNGAYDNERLAFSDWGSDRIYSNRTGAIINNVNSLGFSTVISNNITPREIWDNKANNIEYNNIKGWIVANKASSISVNTCFEIEYNTLSYSNEISGNSNNGGIIENTNAGRINGNSCAGYISGNLNNGSIENNSNNGGINANSNHTSFPSSIVNIISNSNNGSISSNQIRGDIRNNTNAGDILNNTLTNVFSYQINGVLTSACIGNNINAGNIANNNISGAICLNSNNGEIYQNTNGGNITLNSNGGRISSNSNAGRINRNSNGGDIVSNTFRGYLEDNSNNGTINSNTSNSAFVGNNIYQNRNNGYINFNAFNGSGFGIAFNVNNGNIGGTSAVNRTAAIIDTTLNK